MENEFLNTGNTERIYLKTTSIYVLSIIGLLCCCFGGLGIIFSGIAFYMAHTKMKEVELAPEQYENVKGMKDAKTASLIVTVICALNLAYTTYNFATTDWDVIMEQTEEIMQQSGYEY